MQQILEAGKVSRRRTFSITSPIPLLLPILRQGTGLDQFYALPGMAAVALCNFPFMPCSASIQGNRYLIIQSISEKALTILFELFGCMHIVSCKQSCLTENQQELPKVYDVKDLLAL